jgi:hypothetical protein
MCCVLCVGDGWVAFLGAFLDLNLFCFFLFSVAVVADRFLLFFVLFFFLQGCTTARSQLLISLLCSRRTTRPISIRTLTLWTIPRSSLLGRTGKHSTTSTKCKLYHYPWPEPVVFGFVESVR